MALDTVQMLIQAIQAGQQKRHGDQELSLQKQREFDERDARQQAHDLAVKQHDEQKKLLDAQIQELSAKAAAQHLATRQEISKSFLQGIPVNGVSSVPASQGTGGSLMSPVNPQQATQQTITMPQFLGGDQITLPTAQEFAKSQAGLEEIRDKPKVEAKIREAKELQADLLKKQEDAKQADYIRSFMMKSWDDARNESKIKAESHEKELDRKLQLQIANINAQSRREAGMPDDFDYLGYLQRGLAGDVSSEDVNKLGKPGLALKSQMSKAGGKFLSKDEQDVVSDFKMMVDSVKLMDQVIANQPQTNTWGMSHVQGLMNSGNTAVTTPEAELDGRLSNIARGLMKERGALSNRDIERAQALMPSRFQPLNANIQKRDDFVKQLKSVIDAKLSTVPEAQRKVIVNKLGLNDVGLLNGQTPGQSKSFKVGSDTYNIPTAKIQSFLQAHPQAQEIK